MADAGKSKRGLARNRDGNPRSAPRHTGYFKGCSNGGSPLAHASQAEAKQGSAVHEATAIVGHRQRDPVIGVEQRDPQMTRICMANGVRNSLLTNPQQRGGYGRAQGTRLS